MKTIFKIVILIYISTANAEKIDALVIKVADGDTITILDEQKKTHKIRLQGIDAPEKKQAYGEKSKQNLAFLIYNRTVHVEYSKYDKYGRIIGKVSLKGQDICLEQITKGMAWHYKKYQNEQSTIDRELYSSNELKARDKKIGLWNDVQPTTPWDFRKKRILKNLK